MDLIRHIALVADAPSVPPNYVERVAAAVQKQITRDFGPVWGSYALVDAFPSFDDVPSVYWPIFIEDAIEEREQGLHRDRRGQPYARLRGGDLWSVFASQLALEMLCNPYGRHFIQGPWPLDANRRVDFLVEVCKPCGHLPYTLNGLAVCDFVTPQFYDLQPPADARFSYTGAVERPFQVLPHGHMTWYEADSGDWWHAMNTDGQLHIANVAAPRTSTSHLRAVLDEMAGRGGRVRVDDTVDPRLRELRINAPSTGAGDGTGTPLPGVRLDWRRRRD